MSLALETSLHSSYLCNDHRRGGLINTSNANLDIMSDDTLQHDGPNMIQAGGVGGSRSCSVALRNPNCASERLDRRRDVEAGRTSIVDGTEWLIVLTFPNGGSTAVGKLLLSAPGAVALRHDVEGQWLIPELSKPIGRWDPNQPIDWARVRAKWLSVARRKAKKTKSGQPPLVVEKSPPNMCRIGSLLRALDGMKTDVIVLTRDPYATCASWHSRYGQEMVGETWGWPGPAPDSEESYFEALAHIWLQRAAYLRAARDITKGWVKYEDFSTRPAEIIEQFSHTIPRLAGVRADAEVRVKDYPSQGLVNMNAKQVASLTRAQRAALTRGFSRDPELVAELGYAIDA